MGRLSSAQRRDVILDAARNAFAVHGYEGTSMRAIAMSADVTTPVIYDHFDSKQALYVHLLESETDALIALTEELAVGPGRDAALDAGVTAFFQFAQSRPHAWRLLFLDLPGDPHVARTHRAQQRRGDAAVARAIGRLRGETADQAEATDMIMRGAAVRSMLNGLAAWWWDNQDVTVEELVATVMEVLGGRLLERGGRSGLSMQGTTT